MKNTKVLKVLLGCCIGVLVGVVLFVPAVVRNNLELKSYEEKIQSLEQELNDKDTGSKNGLEVQGTNEKEENITGKNEVVLKDNNEVVNQAEDNTSDQVKNVVEQKSDGNVVNGLNSSSNQTNTTTKRGTSNNVSSSKSTSAAVGVEATTGVASSVGGTEGTSTSAQNVAVSTQNATEVKEKNSVSSTSTKTSTSNSFSTSVNATQSTSVSNQTTSTQNGVSDYYVLNKNTKKFHISTCSSVNQMKEANKMIFYRDKSWGDSEGVWSL